MECLFDNINLDCVVGIIPPYRITLDDFKRIYDPDTVDRISNSTGITDVYDAKNDANTSDLCVKAAEELFSKGWAKKSEIDGLVFVSQTPDYIMPATSCILQNRLSLSNDVISYDINGGCSGYIQGLIQSAMMIRSGACNKVLLCVGDTIRKHIDSKDHKTSLILGDGASVSIVGRGFDTWGAQIYTDGSGFDKLIIPRNEYGENAKLYMDGGAVFDFAIQRVPDLIKRALAKRDWGLDSIDSFILHQPNKLILHYILKMLKIDEKRVPTSFQSFGNTGPSSIPITLCHHKENLKKVDRVLMCGFGVGLTYGAITMSLKNTRLYGILTF
jgi:3-oxoacyl-[acyl-carrier-protein] synthase-3